MGALAWCMLLLTADPQGPRIDAGARQTEVVLPAPAAKPRVRFNGATGAAARRAVRGARLRLMVPSCSRLLSEFKDAGGGPLRARLDALGLSAPEYATTVVFVDGSTQPACASGAALGGTQPGSRVVSLCPRLFAETERNNSRLAEALVIHEMLHSLGLGENPPSSGEITARVLTSCPERPPLKEH